MLLFPGAVVSRSSRVLGMSSPTSEKVDLRVSDPYTGIDPQDLLAAITATVPSAHFMAPACTYCGAQRGEVCVSHSGRQRSAYHAVRSTLERTMQRANVPLPADVGVGYQALNHPSGRTECIQVAPNEVSHRYTFTASVPDWNVSPAVPSTVSLTVAPIGGSVTVAKVFRVPRAVVPALSVILLCSQDDSVRARLLGIILSTVPYDQSPAVDMTVAQHMFRVTIPFRLSNAPAVQSRGPVPQHADGRYEFAGCIEPWPGCWPHDAVRSAAQNDLAPLWPYLSPASGTAS